MYVETTQLDFRQNPVVIRVVYDNHKGVCLIFRTPDGAQAEEVMLRLTMEQYRDLELAMSEEGEPLVPEAYVV